MAIDQSKPKIQNTYIIGRGARQPDMVVYDALELVKAHIFPQHDDSTYSDLNHNGFSLRTTATLRKLKNLFAQSALVADRVTVERATPGNAPKIPEERIIFGKLKEAAPQ